MKARSKEFRVLVALALIVTGLVFWARAVSALVYPPSTDINELTTKRDINRALVSNALITLLAACSGGQTQWDGGGATNNWSEAANWCDDTLPASNSTVVFDGTSNKNALIDVVTSVQGVIVNAGYATTGPGTGEVSITTGANLTISSGGWTHNAASFVGGSGDLQLNGPLTINAGSFTPPNGTLNLTGILTVVSGATFSASTGTVAFTGSSSTGVTLPGNSTIDLNNVTINKTGANNITFNATSTLRANGTLNLVDGGINQNSNNGAIGTLEGTAGVTIAPTFDGAVGGFSSATLRISGPSARTVTLPAGVSLPTLTVNAPAVAIDTSGSGSINFTRNVSITSLSLTNGAVDFVCTAPFAYSANFTQGSGSLTFNDNLTQSGGSYSPGTGTISLNQDLLINGGTFTAPSGTLNLVRSLTIGSGVSFNHNNGTFAFISSTLSGLTFPSGSATQFNNVVINKPGANITFNQTSTLQVNGTLTLTDGGINQNSNNAATGTLEGLGPVNIASTFDGFVGGFESATLLISGIFTRTVTFPAGAVIPRLNVSSTNVSLDASGSGTVTFPRAVNIFVAASLTNGGVDFVFNGAFSHGTNFTQGNGNLTFNDTFTQSAGTFTPGSGQLSLASNLNINAGTFTAPTGTLNLPRDFQVGSGATFNHNNGTVSFTGNANTGLLFPLNSTIVLNNATVNKSASAAANFNLTSTLKLNGSLVLTDGTIGQNPNNGAIGTVEVQGNVSIDPTFDGGTVRMTLSGASNQTLSASGVNVVGIWTIDKPSGTVNLSSNLDISNGTSAFNLTNGTITTGSNLVNVGTRTVSRTSGHVIGNLRRSFTATGSKTFDVGSANGYSPVSANVTSLVQNPSSLTVGVTQGVHPNLDASVSLGRFWVVTEIGNLTANLTFNYLDPTDINGSEPNYRVAKIDSNVNFFTEAQIPINRAANTFVVNGVTDFATWTLGAPQLVISPANITLAVQGSQTFTGSGGIPPFTYSIPTNNSGASINSSTGAYTAGTVAGVQDTVRVTDSESRTANAIVTVGQSAPHHLSFIQQPSNSTPGAAITPPVQVAVKDQFNNTIPTATDTITIAIGTNPSSGVLSGTLTRNAVNGVATFNDLSIDKAGSGYTLTANSGSLVAATSNGYNVIGPTQLAFTVQPSNSVIGSAFSPAIQVAIRDQPGNTVTSATNLVTISIANNPGSATLSGTTSKNAVNGIATFSDLSLTASGTGFTLSAASAGLTSATSSAFDVVSPFIVTNTSDSGIGSLRQAIISANSVPGTQTITFNIPGSGPFTILPVTNFPEITEGVVIDGYSQPGAAQNTLPTGFNAIIKIDVDADHQTSGQTFGFRVNASASGVVLRGLRIREFLTTLVSLAGSSHKVQGCVIGQTVHDLSRSSSGIVLSGTGHIIGTDSDGVNDLGERNVVLGSLNGGISVNGSNHFIRGNFVGLGISDARGNGVGIAVGGSTNTVGGTLTEQRNIVGNNTDGIVVSGSSNIIKGNYVGFEATGEIAEGNVSRGILVSGDNNIIGASVSTETGAGNLIGHNTTGVSVTGNNNLVAGNQIGIDNDLQSAGNVGAGVSITGSGNTIGGAGLGNLIGANETGIAVGGPNPNFVLGNTIGQSGESNTVGVLLTSNGNVVGGITSDLRNIIGENSVGIRVSGNGVSGNQILGNWVGVGGNGTSPRGNFISGIELKTGVGPNIIGGPTSTPGTGPGNVISGNSFPQTQSPGLLVNGSAHTIQGNLIGAVPVGTSTRGNYHGIEIGTGSNITIGGPTADTGNVIAGNIVGIKLGANSSAISIQNNYIGTNATGQTWGNTNGIESFGNNITVGGSDSLRNVIAFNKNGIVVKAGAGVRVVANSIFSNLLGSGSHSGLDLGNNGITQNDPGDADTGPNNLQNYPVLNNAFVGGGTTHVVGSLNSTPNTAFTIDFYSSSSCHPNGNGEGQTYLGSVGVSAQPNSVRGFSANVLPVVPAGSFITATATDPAGNTSEYSPCRLLGTNTIAISGKVTDTTATNVPLANAVVSLSNPALTTITDSNGNYRFGDLPGGLTTTITASKANYNITPASISVSNRSIDLPDQNFNGVRTKFTIAGGLLTTINGTTFPLSGVKVTLSGASGAVTTGNTSYVFSNLNPGTYTVTPELEGFAFSPAEGNVTISNTDQVVTFNSVPVSTPTEGRIVFKNGSDIASVNADGTAFVAALRTNTNSTSVNLSSDGMKLRYVSGNSIWTGDSNGLGSVIGTTFTGPNLLTASHSPGGKAAFTKAGTAGIFIHINLQTPTSSVPLGSLASSASHPTWLSESRIAFYANDGSDLEIYAINIDGSGLEKLTSNSIQDLYPVASPDGTRIAFFRSPGATFTIPGNLMVMDVATKVATQISDKFLGSCAWSPDGTRLAISERTTTDRIVAIRVNDGGGKKVLYTGNTAYLFWGNKYEFDTPTGGNVTVQSNTTQITFGGITTPGTTTITPIPPSAAGTAPNGFVIGGVAYEISTTAAYTSPVNICFAGIPAATSTQFNAISFMHNEGGVLVDRTTSRSFGTRTICGSVTTLSPFVLAEQVVVSMPSINGMVRDSNGDPLRDVSVSLSGSEDRTTLTDAFGFFRFINLTENGSYTVQPKLAGHVFTEYSHDFVSLTGEQTVVFTGAPASFHIAGSVVDENSSALSGVTVQLDGAQNSQTTTDSNGQYQFNDLPGDAAFTVTAIKDGVSFSPDAQTITSLTTNQDSVNFVVASATPTPTPTNLTYTALGDSIAFGTDDTQGGYTTRYESFVETDLSTSVTQLNLSVPGATSTILLNSLQTDQMMRSNLGSSSIVTLNIGSNDVVTAILLYRNGQCGGVDNLDCMRSAQTLLKSNLNAIVAELLLLRSTNNTVIRSVDYYNPIVAQLKSGDSWPNDGGLTDFQALKPFLDDINNFFVTLMATNKIPCARASISFNGAHNDEDAFAKGLIAADGFHPSAAGHQLIAELLRVAAYEPIATNAGQAQVQIAVGDYVAQENAGVALISVIRSGSTNVPVSVDFATSNGTASRQGDYIAAFGRLNFAAGEHLKTVPLLIVNDVINEANETFTLTLSNPSGGAALIAPTSANIVIVNDDSGVQQPNPIDDPHFFAEEHYFDFLNRFPDQAGWDFWTNEITSCGSNPSCVEVKRINVSAAFFLSIEFQETGYLIERLYKTAYGDRTGQSVIGGAHPIQVPIVRLDEFLADTNQISGGLVVGLPGWEQLLENNKVRFIDEFVQRTRFIQAFPLTMSAGDFVDQLNSRAGNPLSQQERDELVNQLSQGTKTRAQVVRAVAEDEDLRRVEFNKAFVLMQYFGYLRRNPDDAPDMDHTGYDFWLTKLNQFNGNFIDAEMVKAFISSIEYRQRFAP